jgi:ketosteroid isomerase-like protein
MTPDAIEDPTYRDVVLNTFAADAARDADRFAAKLTAHATFRLGGNPAVVGRDAIRDMVARMFTAFHSVRHRLVQAFECPAALIYEAEVTYTFADGRVVTAPYVNVLRFEGELVSDYRIYLDLSVLERPQPGCRRPRREPTRSVERAGRGPRARRPEPPTAWTIAASKAVTAGLAQVQPWNGRTR